MDESDLSLYNQVLEDINVKEEEPTRGARNSKHNVMQKFSKKQFNKGHPSFKKKSGLKGNMDKLLVGRLKDKQQFKNKISQNRKIIAGKQCNKKRRKQMAQGEDLLKKFAPKRPLRGRKLFKRGKKEGGKGEGMNAQDELEKIKNVMGEFNQLIQRPQIQNRISYNSNIPKAKANLVGSYELQMSELLSVGYESQKMSSHNNKVQKEVGRKRGNTKVKKKKSFLKVLKQVEPFSKDFSINSDTSGEEENSEFVQSKPCLFIIHIYDLFQSSNIHIVVVY